MLTSAPDDFGLSAAATLTHTSSATRSAAFGHHWASFDEAIAALPPRWRGTVLREPDAASEVVVPSLAMVRVTAQIRWPPASARPVAAVLTTHGYGAEAAWPGTADPWSSAGLVTVRLRVRGYPPSDADTGDRRGAWIVDGIESASAWLLAGAVGDVVQTARAAARELGLPVVMHGESLGGGLAVIAAARLSQLGAPPARLAIGLPSLGDWPWRLDHPSTGAGALVRERVIALREDAALIRANLALYDACVHAPDLDCPVLAKLAERDDVVPAPTAAAIFNAMGSPWRARLVTRFGHYDGGLEDLRRHARFERLLPAFLDPHHDPDDAIGEAAERVATPRESPT